MYRLNEDARVPAWFAARRLGISKQTFNAWRTRGKLTPGPDGLYRYGDVLTCDLLRRQSGKSHRGPHGPRKAAVA